MTRLAAALAALALALPVAQARATPLTLAQVHTMWAIRDAAHRWGVNPDYLACLAQHESGFVPWAVGSEGEIGALQIKPDTYFAWSPNALDTAKGPWNAWSNADVAAFMVSRGQSHQWTTTAYCGLYPTAYGE